MPCRVFVSERGNVFMTEIAEHLVEALRLGGRDAELVTDRLPVATADPFDNLVLAPHEFFILFPAGEAERLAAAQHAVCINTEQPGTEFFDLAMRYITQGQVAFDINPFPLDAIRAADVPAVQLPLGYVPSMDRWRRLSTRRDDGARLDERSVDIGFLSGRTPRREAFIAGAAGMLWEWRTDLRFFSWHRPARADHTTFSAGVQKLDALADTRILLNVHRGDEPYFEWARVVEAMANGCVVASERSVGFAPLVPGVHFLMADLDVLAEQAIALALDEPRRAAMADAAHAVLVDALDQRALLDRAFAEARTATRATPRRTRRFRRLASTATPVAPPPVSAERQMLDKTVRDLKQAYLAGSQNVRTIERAIAIAEHGDPDHLTVTATPAFATSQPDITVVIPLFDQGHFLEDAVRSVIAASAVGDRVVDLVIVDDHSTDDSLAVATKLLDDVPWFPIELVARAANGGLPVARNTGFGRARGDLVFALDADNQIYPNALDVLADHLTDAAPEVVAAYGILERFDERGSIGLTSHLPWDVDLLVHGAFIDAMALFRRDGWAALGGYPDNAHLIGGWEDYELWLTAAERGQRADLVPRIVGRYREQPGSMRRISDIDMPTSFVLLRERHPRLPWPS